VRRATLVTGPRRIAVAIRTPTEAMSLFTDRRKRVTRRYNFETLLSAGTQLGVAAANGGNLSLTAAPTTTIAVGAINNCVINTPTITRNSGSWFTDGVIVNAKLTGALASRFPATTRVLNVVDALTLTMDKNATASASNTAASFLLSTANKCEQRAERFGMDNDLFFFLSDGKQFWQRKQYLSCFVVNNPGGYPLNPTVTQYVGVHLSAGPIVIPFPDPPANTSSDCVVMVRARTTDGRWELYQDPGIGFGDARIDVLTGVDPFDTSFTGYASRIEIYYEPDSIRVAINGEIGLSLEGDDVVVGDEGSTRHVGAGCFVTSGTHLDGNTNAFFYDLLTDIYVP